MEAGSLNCPECGAAVSKDATQCQYCHALLQTVACPKCMGMMFLGSKFCPHCGTLTQQIAAGQTSKRTCQRCHVAMLDVKVANTPLEECGRCGGLWVDVSSFEHICSDAEAQTAATGLQLPPPVEVDTHVRYLPCPQCANLMNRMVYGQRSGVVIQVCRPHGIWLDRDEMRQIIEFIRAGGLDRARKLEKEQLDQERKSLDAARFTPEYMSLGTSGSLSSPSNIADGMDLLGGIAAAIGHFLK